MRKQWSAGESRQAGVSEVIRIHACQTQHRTPHKDVSRASVGLRNRSLDVETQFADVPRGGSAKCRTRNWPGDLKVGIENQDGTLWPGVIASKESMQRAKAPAQTNRTRVVQACLRTCILGRRESPWVYRSIGQHARKTHSRHRDCAAD
jgi:hypothetical protein